MMMTGSRDLDTRQVHQEQGERTLHCSPRNAIVR